MDGDVVEVLFVSEHRSVPQRRGRDRHRLEKTTMSAKSFRRPARHANFELDTIRWVVAVEDEPRHGRGSHPLLGIAPAVPLLGSQRVDDVLAVAVQSHDPAPHSLGNERVGQGVLGTSDRRGNPPYSLIRCGLAIIPRRIPRGKLLADLGPSGVLFEAHALCPRRGLPMMFAPDGLGGPTPRSAAGASNASRGPLQREVRRPVILTISARTPTVRPHPPARSPTAEPRL